MDKEVYAFLEELRESGRTNMFGAGIYLQDEFGFGREEARDYVMKWMREYTHD